MITSGIYAIINTVNGKVYVGSTKGLEGRWGQHRRELCKGTHCNPYLQRSWGKHGENAFEFMVCEYVDNLKQLIEREQYWLDFHRLFVNVYNAILVVDRSSLTEEHRRNMSIGKMGHETSDETRSKISKTLMGHPGAMLGCTHTEESKRNMSRAQLGHPVSEETREKLSEINKTAWACGVYDGKETRYKMGKSNRGRPLSEEHKYRISKSYRGSGMLGKHHSGESRQKIGKANSRSYPAFVNEDTGEVIPAGINLLDLCRKWGFTNGIYEVKNGKCRSYRSWVLA